MDGWATTTTHLAFLHVDRKQEHRDLAFERVQLKKNTKKANGAEVEIYTEDVQNFSAHPHTVGCCG